MKYSKVEVVSENSAQYGLDRMCDAGVYSEDVLIAIEKAKGAYSVVESLRSVARYFLDPEIVLDSDWLIRIRFTDLTDKTCYLKIYK